MRAGVLSHYCENSVALHMACFSYTLFVFAALELKLVAVKQIGFIYTLIPSTQVPCPLLSWGVLGGEDWDPILGISPTLVLSPRINQFGMVFFLLCFFVSVPSPTPTIHFLRCERHAARMKG